MVNLQAANCSMTRGKSPQELTEDFPYADRRLGFNVGFNDVMGFHWGLNCGLVMYLMEARKFNMIYISLYIYI